MGDQTLTATAAVAFGLSSLCLRECMSQLHVYLPSITTSHKVFLFFFSFNLTPSPSLFYHLSSFGVFMLRIQNSIHLSVFTTHVHAHPWHRITQRERFGLHFSAGRQTSFGLFVNIWNEIRCRGRLSLKIGITQPCGRINLGYILLSHWSRSVSIPNCIQSLLNKNKGLFYSH